MSKPTPTNEPDDESVADSQPLMSHLIELRTRLLRCVFAILGIFFALYYFANDLYQLISEPLRKLLPDGSSMIATDVASPFFTPFKLTMVVAFFAAMPYILYQAWSYVAPALYQKEKRLALPILVCSVILFYLGMGFAYFLVFPIIFGFFAMVAPEGVTFMPDINSYLDIVLKLFFAFGIAFQIPIATVVLVITGATNVESLVIKRPYIIVGCFVIGMLLTPPDVLSQTMLAVPMWMLFEIGLLFARLIEKERDSSEEES